MSDSTGSGSNEANTELQKPNRFTYAPKGAAMSASKHNLLAEAEASSAAAKPARRGSVEERMLQVYDPGRASDLDGVQRTASALSLKHTKEATRVSSILHEASTDTKWDRQDSLSETSQPLRWIQSAFGGGGSPAPARPSGGGRRISFSEADPDVILPPPRDDAADELGTDIWEMAGKLSTDIDHSKATIESLLGTVKELRDEQDRMQRKHEVSACTWRWQPTSPT